MKHLKKFNDYLVEGSIYLDDNDYRHYIDSAKESLEGNDGIKKLKKGIVRRGSRYYKYIIVQYIKKDPFRGGDDSAALKFFYKDDEHLDSIMKELNLPFNLLDE